MVGAVVVRDGQVVGEGWHQQYGDAHAEVGALREAGDAARGATIYVTLEPCNHTGNTPPCTAAILAAGIARVVAATADPNMIAAGGAASLREHGVDVDVGLHEDDARELNPSFFHALSSARPFIQLKLALSLDGAISDHTRRAGWFTGPEARREVHRLRAGADALAIGIGTARADDPLLTVREFSPPPRVPPVRVVFDTSARLPLASKLVRTAHEVPTIVVCWAPDPAHAAALEHSGVTLIHAATLADALAALRQVGVRSMMVEGGAALAASFIQESLADRLVIFRAPLLLGDDALGAFSGLPAASVESAPRWRIVRTQRLGDDDLTVYAPLRGVAGAL